MKLRAWLETKNVTQVELAAHCRVDPVTVWRWVRGDFIPSTRNARSIVAFTRGKVTYNDLMEGGDAVKAQLGGRGDPVERGEVSD